MINVVYKIIAFLLITLCGINQFVDAFLPQTAMGEKCLTKCNRWKAITAILENATCEERRDILTCLNRCHSNIAVARMRHYGEGYCDFNLQERQEIAECAKRAEESLSDRCEGSTLPSIYPVEVSLFGFCRRIRKSTGCPLEYFRDKCGQRAYNAFFDVVGFVVNANAYNQDKHLPPSCEEYASNSTVGLSNQDT